MFVYIYIYRMMRVSFFMEKISAPDMEKHPFFGDLLDRGYPQPVRELRPVLSSFFQQIPTLQNLGCHDGLLVFVMLLDMC